MFKAIIVANRVEALDFEKDAVYIGVDAGSLYCLQNQIPMLCAIGDFDSIEEKELEMIKQHCPMVVLSTHKDMSDTEYAICYAHEQGFHDIEVYGVTGGRQDHFLAIYHLLRTIDFSFKIKDKQNEIYCLNQGIHRITSKFRYLSFFAYQELHITIEGVKYPLKDRFISEKDVYLLSNEIIDEYATLIIDGKVVVVLSDG